MTKLRLGNLHLKHPVEIAPQMGVLRPYFLAFMWYRPRLAEIHWLHGVSHAGEDGYRTQSLRIWDTPEPQYGGIDLRVCVPGRMPISGLRPEIGKKSLKNRFWSHPENREKIAQKYEKSLKNRFSGHFSFFGVIFSLFCGCGQNRFFGEFFLISGRRPEISILPGTHTRKHRHPKPQYEGGIFEMVLRSVRYGATEELLITIFQTNPCVRINDLPAILGPEVAAPIWWAPGKCAFFLQENRHAHKMPRFRGCILGCIFYGREDFSESWRRKNTIEIYHHKLNSCRFVAIVLVDVSAPKKKYLAPRPPILPNSPQTGPSAPSPPGTPPPWISVKTDPPPSWRLGVPLHPPRAEKITNIETSTKFRARKRHINFEHINFLKVGTTLGQPAG